MVRILAVGKMAPAMSEGDILIHCPLIDIVPATLDSSMRCALAMLQQSSHIIFTSKTAVSCLVEVVEKRCALFPSSPTIIAVGRATAKMAAAIPHKRIEISQNETAEGVVEVLEKLCDFPCHIFWGHASGARPFIKEYLVARGMAHTTCVLYRTQTCAKAPFQPDFNAIDAVFFSSPSCVLAFYELWGIPKPHLELRAIGVITQRHIERCFPR